MGGFCPMANVTWLASGKTRTQAVKSSSNPITFAPRIRKPFSGTEEQVNSYQQKAGTKSKTDHHLQYRWDSG